MFYVLSFFFGACIGSFVQVVATRLHVASVTKARSKCLSCGETLRVLDLVPFFSYLFLNGKCRYCKTSYGISALIIEMFYGVLYLFLYHFILRGQTMPSMYFIWLLYYSLLFITFGVIALYDWAHTYIPVSYLFFYCVLTIGMLIARFIHEPTNMVLLGPIVVSLPFLLIWIISRGRGLGFGDVLLFLGVGAFFGIEQGLAVLLISIWMAAIVGVCIYIFRRKNGVRDTTIPFVPFMMLAFIIVLFTDIDIFSIARIFS